MPLLKQDIKKIKHDNDDDFEENETFFKKIYE